jgi:hypothetical protein
MRDKCHKKARLFPEAITSLQVHNIKTENSVKKVASKLGKITKEIMKGMFDASGKHIKHR